MKLLPLQISPTIDACNTIIQWLQEQSDKRPNVQAALREIQKEMAREYELKRVYERGFEDAAKLLANFKVTQR